MFKYTQFAFVQTRIAAKYRDLDYRLIQRQVKEELQLEKQRASRASSASTIRLFEIGRDEDRVRIGLIELTKLHRDHADQSFSKTTSQQERRVSTLFDSPTVVHSLRAVRDPAPLIASIIANHPTAFSPTIESLLDSDQHWNNSKMILLRLCKLAHYKIWGIRQRLIARKVFPNLAIELTIEHCHDEICFMNRILRGQPEWLTNSVDPITRTSLASIMEFVFSSLNDELTSAAPNDVAVNRLLRILSGMIGLMSLSLSAEQLEISFGVLEMAPLESSTIDVKICLVLMSASQLLKYSQHRLERVLHRMIRCQDSTQVLQLLIYFQQQQLLRIDDLASKSLSMNIVIPRGGLMELSTLFSTVFSDKELSSCALRIGRSDSDIRRTFNLEASKTTVLTSVPHSKHDFTEGDSNLRSTANFIVGHLLQQDVFHKSGTDVQFWVMEQIQASTVPLDANMIHLLRAYTSAILRSGYISRIPESEIRACFKYPAEDPTPAKVLLVLYMLMNNDVYSVNLGSSSNSMERMREYDTKLLEYVQIRKITLYVQNFQDGMAFRAVQPMFLKLVNSQFPELFDVTTLLLEEGMATSVWSRTPSSRGPTVGHFAVLGTNKSASPGLQDSRTVMASHLQAISQHISDPDAAVKGYHAFQRLPQVDRQTMAADLINASLPSLLDPLSRPPVIEAFKNTWDQLNSVMPHEVWALTIHALLPQSPSMPASLLPSIAPYDSPQSASEQLATRQKLQKPTSSVIQYTFDWFVQDPLLLFKVNFQTFRSPMVFRLFIQILGAVMTGSRHWYRKQLHVAQAVSLGSQHRYPSLAQRRQFKEANMSAMLYIQDSALVQLLLEACEARPEDLSTINFKKERGQGGVGQEVTMAQSDKKGSPDSVSSVLQEVRTVTFNFLHQLFIDHKIFPKLVHFQGYAMDLLPSTVAGIDSIHVCLDFLQEILFSTTPTSMLAASSVSVASAGLLSTVGLEPGEERMDIAPQVFALRLAAHLCERFPLQTTMQMTVDFILPRLQALAISTGFSREVLESAVILTKAFPSLRDDIVSVLRETSRPQDKLLLEKTIEAIRQELLDPAVLDKSLL
ncbi:Integrator complex subunit 2 [Mortierella claussenii]|nr:Integrator complex subunit 2 [Mortierella claussenii]